MAQYIAGFRDGTVAERLNLPTIRALPVAVPPLPVQRAIAHILGTLDDKIELNRKMNETLEQMARAIFKSWFIDFEPFRDKSMIDSPLGKIPKGWTVTPVSELCVLSRDSLQPSAYPEEVFAHYSIPAFDEGRMPKLEPGCGILSNKLTVPEGVVLLSKLNPRIPRVWLPDVSGSARSICSTEFLVVRPNEMASREFLWRLFCDEAFVSEFSTHVTGTSSSHQRVRPESLEEIRVAIPTNGTIGKFNEHVSPMLKAVSQNLHENQSLAAIRDALLPKLMSGEVSVRGT